MRAGGAFLRRMLTVAAGFPTRPQRDQFADRLAHKARITEEVVRAEIRRAAVNKQTDVAEVERRTAVAGAGESGGTRPDLGSDPSGGRRR